MSNHRLELNMYYPVWQVNVAAVHGWESNAQWKYGEEEECNCECHLITSGSVQNHIQTVDIWYFQLSNKSTNHFSHFLSCRLKKVISLMSSLIILSPIPKVQSLIMLEHVIAWMQMVMGTSC